MKNILFTLLLSLTISGWAQKQPNVLFIAIDDLKPMLGCYGDETIKSPAIDKLASSGVVFTNAQCQQAICGPSRASIMTGMRPDYTRVWDLKTRMRDVNPDILSIPQHFKNNGYTTVAIGKIYDPRCVGKNYDAISWSIPYKESATYTYPEKYGPPGLSYYALEENKREVDKYTEEAKAKGVRNIHAYVSERHKPSVECADVEDDAYMDTQIANNAIKYMKQFAKDEKPFFLAVGFKRPHLPFTAPKKYWDLYEREDIKVAENQDPVKNGTDLAYHRSGELKSYTDIPALASFSDIFSDNLPEWKQKELIHGYKACVSYIDAQIDRLITELKKNGLDENTVIVLWGDHGWHLGDHSMWCKHSNFEQATRVPLILSVPGGASGLNSHPVEFIDIFPTLCEATGIQIPEILQGESLMPTMKNAEAKVKDYAVSQYGRGSTEGYSLRTEQYRLTLWFKDDYRTSSAFDEDRIVAGELYDYNVDPLETENFYNSKKYEAVKSKLLKDFADFVEEQNVVLDERAEMKPWVNGAWETGEYRNVFLDAGYSQVEIDKKLAKAYYDVFEGPERVYFEVGDSMAYVSDLKNHDARTEGLSYGMMVAVQLDKKDVFDRLWRWTKKYMQHQGGSRDAYFAWSVDPKTGKHNSEGSASDGELYFVTDLLFASNRWGNETGIDYYAEARRILDAMWSKDGTDGIKNVINVEHKQINFVPDGSGYDWTDPSYHVAAFFEIWAEYAKDGKEQFYRDCADTARVFLHRACHPVTGLNADYTEFSGVPRARRRMGTAYRYDSWRVPMNIAMDYSWYAKDIEWQQDYSKRFQNFLYSKGVDTFVDQFNIDGTTPEWILPAGGFQKLRHSLGLVSTSAAASIMGTQDKSWEFIDELWNAKLEPYEDGYFDPYFDGLMYLFSIMHLSGNYQIITPATQSFEGYSWETIECTGEPVARHEAAFIEADGLFYLMGGRRIQEVSIFNPETNTWTSGAKPPIELHHFEGFSYKGDIYAVGVQSGGYPHETSLAETYIYKPANDSWEESFSLPKGRIRASTSTKVYKDKLYLACGIIDGHWDGHVRWFDCYDFKTGKWEQLPDAPRNRDHACSVICDDKLYLLGGRVTSGSIGKVFQLTVPEVDVFDFKTGKWSTLDKPVPTTRAGCTAFCIEDKIIFTGGETSDQKLAHNEVECLNTKTGEWTKLPSLNTGRHGTQLIWYKKKLYIASGSGQMGGSPELTSIEYFTKN